MSIAHSDLQIQVKICNRQNKKQIIRLAINKKYADFNENLKRKLKKTLQKSTNRIQTVSFFYFGLMFLLEDDIFG